MSTQVLECALVTQTAVNATDDEILALTRPKDREVVGGCDSICGAGRVGYGSCMFASMR